MSIRASLLCCALQVLCVFAQPLFASEHRASSSLARSVERIILENGMTFLILRRDGVPVFSAHIDVKAGGIEEKPGQSGLAHMLEHMAFKGTDVIGTRDYERERPILEKISAVGRKLSETPSPALKARLVALEKEAGAYRNKGEFERIYEENGGSGLNASTSKDFTSYYISLPKNRLELWAELESERFLHPVMREFYFEKDVVIQERRQRTDNNPMGKFYERFLQEAFGEYPYGVPTIGSVQDLRRLTVEDLRAFFDAYYTPDRMAVSLVGDLPPTSELRPLLERSFGRLERPSASPQAWPAFDRVHQTFFEMTLDAEPVLFIGYPKPTAPSRDDMGFDLLAAALCEGDSSRLVKALVLKKGLASGVDCDTGVPGARLPHLFVIEAKPFPGVSLQALLSAIDEELAAFKVNPLPGDELEKIRHGLYSDLVWGHETNRDLAALLAYYESLVGDWRYLLEFEKTVQRIGARELQKLAQRYLDTDRRTVGFLNKAKAN